MSLPRRHLLTPVLSAFLLNAGAAAQTTMQDALAVQLTLASDYVLRGVSQSDEGPALQLGVAYEHPSGVFAGVFASTVDFSSQAARFNYDDDRDVEVDLHVGYAWGASPDWTLSALWARYQYPGGGGGDFDYGEVWAAIDWRGRGGLAVGYSSDALGLGEPAWTWEATWRQGLPWRLQALAGLGSYDLDTAFGDPYRYWNLSLARSWGRWTLEAGYYGTDATGERLYGNLAGDRLVTSLGWRVW